MTLYQIDAFTNKLFTGNPAAVIPLEKWIDESLMQNLAMENNLSETVFFVPNGNDFDIRWFTPGGEINLCGHATLASAYVLFTFLGYKKPSITFHSKSGPLVITRDKEIISMDFPSWKPERVTDYPKGLEEALGVKEIVGVYKYRDLLVELYSEKDVRQAEPDFTLIKKTNHKIIITAPGAGAPIDFVSRFFAPTLGVDEDPVTGSAHSQLIPFWSEKLDKTKMEAMQLSKRGGHLRVEQKGDRVQMGGQCVFYMKGEVEI
jgi:PhzF family phenazine biosynthesis protein